MTLTLFLLSSNNTKELKDDWDTKEELEQVESMCPSELNDTVLNEMLAGMATLVEEEIDDGNTGAGINGWSGDCGATSKWKIVGPQEL